MTPNMHNTIRRCIVNGCLMHRAGSKETPREPSEPEVPNLPTDPDEPDVEQPITTRLGLKQKAGHITLSILTESDGSEDPGSELDTEFSHH